MLQDPAIDLVLNLTPAYAHAAVTHAALSAGKHVYSEKPLALSLHDADALIALAQEKRLLLACAPATLLQPPLRAVQALLNNGAIGDIVSALAVIVYPGPELFHPSPVHLYQRGAGPVLDMGVYPLTAVLALLGPVTETHSVSAPPNRRRTVLTGPSRGAAFSPSVPTTTHAILRHASGALTTLLASFDGFGSRANGLEIHGTAGAIALPLRADAEHAVLLSKQLGEWRPHEGVAPPEPQDHAIGLIQAWRAFHDGAPVIASAARARETLAVMAEIAPAALAPPGERPSAVISAQYNEERHGSPRDT